MLKSCFPRAGYWLCLAVVIGVFPSGAVHAGAGKATVAPTATQIQAVVDRYFAEKSFYRPGDLIAQSDVQAVITALGKRGWKVPGAKQLVAKTLPDSHPLVQLLASDKGRRFMRAVQKQRLIYDRLDRVMGTWGGPAMLRQLIRLPDGARYAAWKTPSTIPDLLDLLPKRRSGKTRVIKDYRKPTGQIYTQQQLTKALVKLFHPSH